MTIQEFRIGAGPDYVMTKGKVVYRHRANLTIVFENEAESKECLSHASLRALIVEIREKLASIGWISSNQIDWSIGKEIVGDAKGLQGLAKISFRFPQEVSYNQRSQMLGDIGSSFP